MPFLVAEGSAVGFAEVADALFRDAVAFGVLASGQEILVEQFEQYLPRLASLARILDVAEPAGLSFGDEPFPFMANTVKWGRLPLAGHTGSAGGPHPSQVLASLWEAWSVALTESSRSARHSLLLAALWHAWHEGLGSALELAIDLSCSGYLLNRTDLEAVVTLLLSARNAVGSDTEMVTRLLGGVKLDSVEALASSTLTVDWVPADQPASPMVGKLVERILQSLLQLAATARRSRGLDEWVLNQQRLYNTIGPLLHAIRNILPQVPLLLQTVVSNLDEINADAGNFCRTIKLKLMGDPSYALLVSLALPVMFEYRRLMGEGWQERLCTERVLVPDELRPLMLDIQGEWPSDLISVIHPKSGFAKAQITHQVRQCPEPWKELSYELAHPFVSVMRPELRDPELVGAPSYIPADLLEHPLVVEACARHDISELDARRQALAQALHSRPSRFLNDRDRLVAAYASEMSSGLILPATQIDLDVGLPPLASPEPARVDDDVIQAVVDAATEVNRSLLNAASGHVAELLLQDEPAGALVELFALQSVLPWSAEIWDAFAAALSRMGDLGGERHAVQAALHLQPRQKERWRLLAAILAHTSRADETIRVTEAIAELWA
jgi:hypothetical protein